MPQPLRIDWEVVRQVAVQIGVREAARQFGLQEGAVTMRSSREGWFKAKPVDIEASAIVEKFHQEKGTLPAVVTKGSDVLLRLADRSKLRLARTVDRTAGTLNKLKGPILLQTTQALKNTVDAASKLHGWGQDSEKGGSLVNINVLGVDPGSVR